MGLFAKTLQFNLKTLEPSVVYTYSIDDTPGKTLGVKVPRSAIKTAQQALLAAHTHHGRRPRAGGKLVAHRAELMHTALELKKASRSYRRSSTGDYYFLGPIAASVHAGLTVGARVLSVKHGQDMLAVQPQVLTNHEYVDVHRMANRQQRPGLIR